MSYIDAGITVGIGLLLVARPRAFTRRRGSEAERLFVLLRRVGYLLIGVGVLLAAATYSRT